jgi:hypothetical protein
MSLIADVIIPAFSAPYVAPLLFPVAGILAITSEVLIFWLLNRQLGVGKIIPLVVLANVVSTVVGFLLTAVLPSGWVPTVIDREGNQIHTFQPGPYFTTYLILAFVIAFVLSVAIEYGVVRLAARSMKVIKPFLTVTLANLASYIVLILVAWLWTAFL